MFGIGIARGMLLTLRHLFKQPFTFQYPEERRPIPENARTNLLWFEERCTGCSTCAQACPDGCILVQTSPNAEDGTLNIDRYEIDFRLCMYCGLCVEACPYEAIQAGGPYDDAVYDFGALYRDKHALTAMAQEYLRTHDWTYPIGKVAPKPEERDLRLGKASRGVGAFTPDVGLGGGPTPIPMAGEKGDRRPGNVAPPPSSGNRAPSS
ncbi:MAG: NADH-quinone oxidoreductase subunit I [Chloroflexi bacterium]|nr:NADH-quinone oxidoreductase subunit I [Chloroflexota bacterium]